MRYYIEFSELLNQYLLRIDRSASWLAHSIGVNPATVARWRSGETRPKEPETVAQIADLLGVHGENRQRLLHAAGYGVVQNDFVGKRGTQVGNPNSPNGGEALPTFKTPDELQDYILLRTRVFGKEVSSLLKGRGCTQKDLAKHLDVSQAAVSQWHKGLRIPNAETLHEMTKILKLTPNETESLLQAWIQSKLMKDLLGYLSVVDDSVDLEMWRQLVQSV